MMSERQRNIRGLNGLGSIEVTLKDTNGRRMFHWNEGNVSLGLQKTLEHIASKAGISQDLILEEIKKHRPDPLKPRRRL